MKGRSCFSVVPSFLIHSLCENTMCRTTKHCLDLATEQDNTITEKWLPELKTAVLNAQTSLSTANTILIVYEMQLDEWYEQPAATVVDWVTVDGQNVAAWHNHVKSSYCLYDKDE
ncbi:hypothetical protein Bca52824_061290 [Brassica carinata]|uniref:Uncharacterized protein n=1 Tax=Brassica carinata TaxID=52824 RepID=A0A8X7QY66_BRACI|nr:hypothetical protein Bca52824_061290 [Brassica carinata]